MSIFKKKFRAGAGGGKGFTLIELLVVIAIIGILASVVLASLNSARKKSRDARRIADIKQIQLALELYFDTARSYPVGVDAVGLVLLKPTYMSVLPTDPVGGASYKYTQAPAGCLANCTNYHLGGVLEDAGNPTLLSDADGIIGFNGASADCVGGAGADQCYDVVP